MRTASDRDLRPPLADEARHTRRALVVGGGIAGLAAARALTADGWSVLVAEQASAWAPAGAGIVLARNAMRVLDHLAVGEAVRRRGRALPAATIADADGDPLLDMGGAAELIAIHRADLHAALLNGLSAEVRLGTTVEALAIGDAAVTVTLRDGTEHSVDIVVGSDGLRSRVRQLLRGTDGPKVLGANQRVWRMVTEDRVGLSRALEQWGPGRRVGLIPLTDDRIYAFLVEGDDVHAPDDAPDDAGAVAALQQRFAAFAGPAGDLLGRLAPDTPVLRHDIEEVDRVDFGAGRVVLIGDAAHAMTPNLGQGAAQALEDVPVLVAACRSGDPSSLVERVAARRLRRVRAVKRRSAKVGQVGQLSSPTAVALRNALIRATPAGVARRAGRAVTDHDPLGPVAGDAAHGGRAAS